VVRINRRDVLFDFVIERLTSLDEALYDDM
jgi:hypothetical protein